MPQGNNAESCGNSHSKRPSNGVLSFRSQTTHNFPATILLCSIKYAYQINDINFYTLTPSRIPIFSINDSPDFRVNFETFDEKIKSRMLRKSGVKVDHIVAANILIWKLASFHLTKRRIGRIQYSFSRSSKSLVYKHDFDDFENLGKYAWTFDGSYNVSVEFKSISLHVQIYIDGHSEESTSMKRKSLYLQHRVLFVYLLICYFFTYSFILSIYSFIQKFWSEKTHGSCVSKNISKKFQRINE